MSSAPKLALSIRAPWWWFILHGGKDIENREWPTRYRGPIFIHASKWFQPDDVKGEFSFAQGVAKSRGCKLPSTTLRDLRDCGGSLVGRARIVDCLTKSDSPWFFGRYGFALADIEALPQPIPCKGKLGFFDVSEAVDA